MLAYCIYCPSFCAQRSNLFSRHKCHSFAFISSWFPQQHRRGEGRERENEQSNGQQRRSDYTDVSKLSKGKQRMKGTKWAKGPAKVSNWITELSLQGDVGLLRLLFQWSHDAKWFLTQSFQYDLNMSSIGCPLAQCLSFHVNVVVKLQHPLNSRRKFHEDLLYVAVWRCLAVFGFVCFCPEKMNALFEYV